MANKKIPLRKCVACNEMKEKKEMIRVSKHRKMKLYWMPPVAKTAVGHTSVQILSVFAWRENPKDLSAPLRLQFRRMCMKVWKRR